MRFTYLILPFLLLFPLQPAAQAQSAEVDVSSTFTGIHVLQTAAHQAYADKNWARAVQLYRQYLALSPLTVSHTEVNRRLRRAERILSQHSRAGMSFLLYPQSFGGSYFEFLKDDWSFYVSLRGRDWVAPDVWEIDEEDRPTLDEGQSVAIVVGERYASRYTRTYEDVLEHLLGTFGITQKLVYPVWVNVGVTVGYQHKWLTLKKETRRVQYWEQNAWTELDDPRHLRDESVASFVLGGEAGLSLSLGWVTAQYGVSYTFGKIDPYWGFGFSPAY